MKAIAIIEVPEGGKGKWYINGEIRYTENRPLMQKFDIQMITLKPLPSFKAVDLNDTRDVVMFCHGWNTCLAEITGETE